ncbi:hypothetical protein F5X96DRAFT_622109 [Biscogniauxia mediterranea]|nr:hypothetical protein F5X96DRAFT_622109 [Biscogniauxia mediterranea]
MADFTTTYNENESETAPSERREDVTFVDGPASFLALASKLGVPLLARRPLGGGGGLFVGGGLSFSVGRVLNELRLRKETDWANKVPHDWFDPVAIHPNNDPGVIKIPNYITKRIVLSRHRKDHDKEFRDTDTFAAITTEVRILSHEAVRHSRNIVALIGISWGARETSGRFLPELLLENASHNSLSQYIQVSHHRLGFCDKVLMLLDIASGLGFLHENGIVHCDVKPSNILVYDCPARQPMETLDMKPYIVKLCDFGSSVILSDYPEDHKFILKVGTPGWMAPEMEQGLALDSRTLPKTDIYSLGHVAASIAVKTRLSITVVPRAPLDEMLASRESHPPRGIKLISSLLADAARDQDQTLNETQLTVFSEIISCTLQSDPADRADASRIYRLCRNHLLKELQRHPSEKSLNRDLRNTDYLQSMLPGYPESSPAKTGRIRETGIVRVPDLAFEENIRNSQIPGQCRKEVYRDLERRVAGTSRDAGDCAVQLAALVLNGYLEDDGKMDEKAGKYLIHSIACGSEVAMSGGINVFQAMGQELPRDSRLRIQKRFQDPNFREHAMAEIKSLFFPLKLGGSLGQPKPSARTAGFPYTHRQSINEKLVGVRTWAREFRQDFLDYLASQEYRRHLYTAILRILNQDDAIPTQTRRQPPFDSMIDRYIHDPGFTFNLQKPNELNLFAREVCSRDMRNEPTEIGLTLLQLSVCRGDLLVAGTLLQKGLGGGVNACGKTPNWTPLWLACLLGYYELACLLIQNGADMSCQDSVQGITLLHLLCQFSNQNEVEDIGRKTLAAGVDVNAQYVVDQKKQDGVTPLLASMLVFDFSDGAARTFLLSNGANPLYFTTSYSEALNLPVSPLSLCMLDLNPALLESILSTDFPSRPRIDGRAHARVAQAVGVQLMSTKTCFHTMLETGRNYRNLKSVLQMVSKWEDFHSFSWNPNWSPLAFACDIDRADILELLLKLDPNAPIDIKGVGMNLNMLEQCVIRHNFRSVEALIQHGTDVLGSASSNESMFSRLVGPDGKIRGDQVRHGMNGETLLVRIAKDMPSILGFVINYLESLQAEKRGGRSVRSILESRSVSDAGIFDTLILEGGSEELVIAEALRVKYRLDHDRVQPYPPNTTSLIGAVIASSNAYGYAKLEQVRYLLSLSPKPKFDLPGRVNLLQMATTVTEGSKCGEASEDTRNKIKLTN